MCGIVGYIGKAKAAPILLDGLRRLEYRGYDSAGIVTIDDHRLDLRKTTERISHLTQLLKQNPAQGSVGICHTRWATHGGVTVPNAHPHYDQSERLAVVHNGVIENYSKLRDQLLEKGHIFRSDTDTEVLAHLIGRYFDEMRGDPSKQGLVEAVRRALQQVQGTYGIAVLHLDVPDLLVAARRGSPLVLGIGKGENFIASDVSAIVAHTREAVYLNDFDIAAVEKDSFEVTSLAGEDSVYEVSKVDIDEEDISKGKYPHFMLKEIYEQPQSIRDAMRGRLSIEEATAKLGGLEMTAKELREIDRIVLTGCGTALYAGMVGEYLIESLALVPTEVEFASEFRYRNVPTNKDTLVFVISQSGETADSLAALRESKRKGHRTLGICNNVASTIARETDGGVYMHAGAEIGVAATKSFTSQITILTLIALLLGRMRHLSSSQGSQIIAALEEIPDKVAKILGQAEHIKAIAEKYAHAEGMMFLGRQFNYPIALEGALKLKEISYMNASGHPSAELKHGVIALIRPEIPTVVIAPRDAVFEKNMSNIEEVRARKGPVISIGTEGSRELEKVSDDVIYIPNAPDFLTPLLTVIPLQLFAYHLASTLGCDIDKPRNLAKAVTVE